MTGKRGFFFHLHNSLCAATSISIRRTIMSSSHDTLQFTLSTYGDSILCKMNVLREECRFCDITLILGNPNGPTEQPLRFHGHRVVLAASSDFLRDQFLLHEGQTELHVGVVSSERIAKSLLLSCYTGLLEVPLRELVNYLVASSVLQMGQVVEKCGQAISQYLGPIPAFLKLESYHMEKKSQQLGSNWTSSSFENQREKDAVQPSSSIREAHTQGGEAVISPTEVRTSQEKAEVLGQDPRVIIEDREVVKKENELSETLTLDTSESENAGNIKPFYNPSLHVRHDAATIKCDLHPPSGVQDIISSPASKIRGPVGRKELEKSLQKHCEQEARKPTGERNMCTLVNQHQQGRKLVDSKLFCLSGADMSNKHMTADDMAENSENMLVQRPYLCRRCDKIFQHLESYVGHLKEHRQYFCLLCGEGFSQKSKLICHIHVHTGPKPFRCPLCHETFTQKALLLDHLHQYTGQGPHKCALHTAHKSGFLGHLSD